MNTKGKSWICVMLCVATLGSIASAESAVEAKRSAQRKLLAYRAARVDAMRKLAEQIKGLTLTSSTTVQDFVTSNDTIEASMRQWLLGMKEEGKPRYMEDGTCEVRMSVTLRVVERELKRLYTAHYKGDKVKMTDIQKITERNSLQKIEVIGMGAAPEPLMDEPVTVDRGRRGSIPPYWQQHCTGRGRLMAVRAARTDAMRRLAERIKGVRIDSNTTVQDFVAESDDINVDMRHFLRGAKEIATRYHRDELIVEVEMEVTLKTVITSFKSWADVHVKGDRVKLKKLEDYVEKVRYDKIVETGMGVPPEKYLKDYQGDYQALEQASRASMPDWVNNTIRATGQAAVDTEMDNPAQAKLMAYRAAELDARRKLAEKLDGLMITSNSSVRDFVAQSDTIETKMLTYQQGAHVVEGSQKIEDGIAEVTVEIELKPLWRIIVFYRKQYPVR